MEEQPDGSMICDQCDADAVDGLKYCPNCGALYEEGVKCVLHPEVNAIGVCVLCGTAGCADCCHRGERAFLCTDHEGYEIMEGHALVLTLTDSLQSGLAEDALTSAGLHPHIYTTTYNPGVNQVSQWMYTVYERRSTYFKVFVPFNEVGEAQKVLEDFQLERP